MDGWKVPPSLVLSTLGPTGFCCPVLPKLVLFKFERKLKWEGKDVFLTNCHSHNKKVFFFFFLIYFCYFPFFFFFSFLFLLFRSVVELALFPRGGQAKHKRILKKNKTFMTKKLYLMFFNGTKIIYNWFEMKFFSSVFILNSQLNNIYLKFHVLYCRNLGSHLKKKYLFFLRI